MNICSAFKVIPHNPSEFNDASFTIVFHSQRLLSPALLRDPSGMPPLSTSFVITISSKPPLNPGVPVLGHGIKSGQPDSRRERPKGENPTTRAERASAWMADP